MMYVIAWLYVEYRLRKEFEMDVTASFTHGVARTCLVGRVGM